MIGNKININRCSYYYSIHICDTTGPHVRVSPHKGPVWNKTKFQIHPKTKFQNKDPSPTKIEEETCEEEEDL